MALSNDKKINNLDANAERIKNIDRCFGNDNSNKLYKDGRVLVGEGVLLKMCRKGPKVRGFFLFNDLLVYGTCVIDKRRYINQHVIPLNYVQIKSIPDGDDSKLRNGWEIKSPKKSFCVYATTSKEKNDWILHITNCINKLNNDDKTSITDNKAPIWIPDNSADTCMRCNKTKFTVVNRRHHCRFCGFLVCGECSKNKYKIISISDEPVRVCNECYVILSSQNQKNDVDTSGESDTENNNYTQEPRFYSN